MVSDEVAALGGFACSPCEYSATGASWYLHGVSKPPHIPFGWGGEGERGDGGRGNREGRRGEGDGGRGESDGGRGNGEGGHGNGNS